jgi:hypothetical protein
MKQIINAFSIIGLNFFEMLSEEEIPFYSVLFLSDLVIVIFTFTTAFSFFSYAKHLCANPILNEQIFDKSDSNCYNAGQSIANSTMYSDKSETFISENLKFEEFKDGSQQGDKNNCVLFKKEDCV